MTLLIIDVQKQITSPALFAFDRFINSITQLLAAARANKIEVIYVRHDDGPGKPLTNGRDGFEIYEAVAPISNEKIFDKTVNSPFKGSKLLQYLKEKNETELIIAGLQTDYCIDAAVKCGFEHGFHIIVPEYTNTTFDNAYMSAETSYRYHNEFLWKNRYAECISLEKALEHMRK